MTRLPALPSLLTRLVKSREGATVVEFALIGPIFIALLLVVFQFSAGMQAYNALRAASADVQRHVVVEYQTGNRLSVDQIQAYALGLAQDLPYLLKSSNISATAEMATTQRVGGATEYSLNYTYGVPNMMTAFGFGDITIRFSRPIFVPASAAS